MSWLLSGRRSPRPRCVKQRIERILQWVRDGRSLPRKTVNKRVKHHAAFKRTISILAELPHERGGYVFPGAKAEAPLSNMAMLELLRGMDENGFTVHGFRSTFRDWAGDRTNFARDVIKFRCRQGWGRRVAYISQFLSRDHRAHHGKEKIKARLLGDCDPDEWEMPPKPKWMRWRTYNRLADRFDSYQEILDEGVPELLAKLFGPSE